MKKAIGYIRVSTERQAKEGVSLDAQRAKIEQWCAYTNCELVQIFVDEGISGYTMKRRPGLLKALAAVQKDMAIVVYSLSRLARSTRDTLDIADTLSKRGADLVSLSEKLDTTGAAGKMMFRMLAVLAEFERDVTSDRTVTALAHKKAKGEKYACTPFGFSENRGKLKQDETEAQVIADMVIKRAAGSSYAEIAGYLNQAGIPGKKGGKWHPSTVRYVINRQETAA
jgi:site-specific DNA recombinase